MAPYYHVANKKEILDGILDLVFGEIEPPNPGGDWRTELTRRAHSARRALRRHPWAIVILQSGTAPGPATLRHHDAVIGTLREAGFSVTMTAHAYALLDSYIYGFALSETALPINGPETVAEVAESMMQRHPLDDYPYLAEFSTEHILRPELRLRQRIRLRARGDPRRPRTIDFRPACESRVHLTGRQRVAVTPRAARSRRRGGGYPACVPRPGESPSSRRLPRRLRLPARARPRRRVDPGGGPPTMRRRC